MAQKKRTRHVGACEKCKIITIDRAAERPLPCHPAIERHLDVHARPTYKLFNRNGELLDINVDPRNLEELARLLERVK